MDTQSKLDAFDQIYREHEDSILGAVFLDPPSVENLHKSGLRAWHFSRPIEREVWILACELVEQSKSTEARDILLKMRSKGMADNHYNSSWIGSLANRSNVNQAVTWNSLELQRLAKLRQLQKQLPASFQPDADPVEIANTAADLAKPTIETQLRPIAFGDLERDNPSLHVPIVDGLLRAGETANVIAPAKTGKSFLVGGLAWCVATGRPWLGRSVLQSNVLIVDNELHKATIANRLERIAWEMKVDHKDRKGVFVESLRGKLVSIDQLTYSIAVEPGQYGLVILDALYRMLPRGVNENDNAAMTGVYNELDNLANKWQAAVVVVHHSSKGNQGDKSVTDVGAGAGSIARAADTHIAIREHESEGHHVLEARTRSFPSPEPMSVKYEHPLWTSTTLEPAVKRQTRQSTEAQQQADRSSKAELFEQLPPSGMVQQTDLVDATGWGKDRVKRIAALLIKDGKLSKTEEGEGIRKRVFYARTEFRTESRTELFSPERIGAD